MCQRTNNTINWPLKNIRVPGDHDVVFGRGGASIHHPGCKAFREMVRSHQRQYIGYNDSRHMKTLLTHELVKQWREQSPPGRFLKKDEATGLWHDVGTASARRKTAQLLREGAKKIRKEMQAESEASSSSDEEESHSFATAPTQQQETLVEFAPRRGLARPTSPPASARETMDLPTPVTPPASTCSSIHALSAELRALVRTAPQAVFQYGQPKNSIEMLQIVFEDILDDTTVNPQQAPFSA